MKSSIYEYRDYKVYITDLIENDPSGGRGKRKDLANAMSCQVSHVTNVLSGDGHLNPEQAHAASEFFGLSPLETEFLLMLIQYSRAATQNLKRFFEKLLNEKQEKNTALKNRLKMPDSMKTEEESRYYSSWQVGAIHVLLSIAEFQTREAIAKKLNLPIKRVDEILIFLVETGLAKKDGQLYTILRSQLHLDKTSPLISKHHSNWRMRSILSLDQIESDHLHYSSVFTLSKKDYGKVRELLSNALTESFKIITASPEEESAVICLDMFQL